MRHRPEIVPGPPVHQVSSLCPEISATDEPLWQLLRPKNAWVWTEEHTIVFNTVKKLLVSPPPPAVGLFDSKRRTVLESQTRCRFLSDTESRYATIEVMRLALTWAANKSSIDRKGMQHLEVLTDHRPLVPIPNKKSVQDIENLRLQRLREVLTTSLPPGASLRSMPDQLMKTPPCKFEVWSHAS